MADLPREKVLRASADWQWIPPGSETLLIAGVRATDYPERGRMRFIATPATVTDPPAEVIAAVQSAAQARGRTEADWWISVSTAPAELEQHLLRRGAALKVRLEIMALDMTAGTPEMNLNPAVECRLVADARTLDDAERVGAAVWGGDPSGPERRAEQLRAIGDPLGATGEFRVVAYLDGRAICTAGCQVAGDVARLYGGATLEDARGHGAYRATIAKRLDVAFAHGARVGLVHASVTSSMPILNRLGFRSFGEIRVYTLPV